VKPIKKTLTLKISGQEIDVNVDFDIIRIIEEVYQRGADMVIPMFERPDAIQRHKVARVIAEWSVLKLPALNRRDVMEEVARARAEDFGLFAGSIYAALCFLLNYFDQDDAAENERRFDEVSANLKTGGLPKEDETPKKGPRGGKVKKQSSESATKLQ
jgi:hypothetical protein